VHTAEELARAQEAGARLIGVNSRNLKTLGVSLDTRVGARAAARPGRRRRRRERHPQPRRHRRADAAGYHAFLVGERFMSQPDPGAALAELMGEPA
jgi:indole-3-glycerol phosphate synthase